MMSATVVSAVVSLTTVCGKTASNTIEPDVRDVDRASLSETPFRRPTSAVSASLSNSVCAVGVSRFRSPPKVTSILTDAPVGVAVGRNVGENDGTKVGRAVGAAVGAFVGRAVGNVVGLCVVGATVGNADGAKLGAAEGVAVGASVSHAVSDVRFTNPPLELHTQT